MRLTMECSSFASCSFLSNPFPHVTNTFSPIPISPMYNYLQMKYGVDQENDHAVR